MKALTCNRCGKDMGVVRDGKLRNHMVIYCKTCDDHIQLTLKLAYNKKDSYDPFGGIFGKF